MACRFSASCPRAPRYGKPKTGNDSKRAAAREAEIFGLLRAHIRYFNVDRDLRLIVVVSAAPGDGKSDGRAEPGNGHRDGGIASPVPRGRPPTSDGREVLRDRSGRRDYPRCCSARSRWTAPSNASSSRAARERTIGVDVLVAGGVLPPNPPQVIESQAMAVAASEAARGATTWSSIDTPPLVLLPDAFPLLRQADGVLIVSRLGENRSDVAAQAARDARERGGAGHRRDRQRIQATPRLLGVWLWIQLSIRLLGLYWCGPQFRRPIVGKRFCANGRRNRRMIRRGCAPVCVRIARSERWGGTGVPLISVPVAGE